MISHQLAPLGVLLVAVILYMVVTGNSDGWLVNALLVALLAVAGTVVLSGVRAEEAAQAQHAASTSTTTTSSSSSATTSNLASSTSSKSSKESRTNASVALPEKDISDSDSVHSDGALSDINSAIAPIAATPESVPDEDSTLAEGDDTPLDTDTPDIDFASVLSPAPTEPIDAADAVASTAAPAASTSQSSNSTNVSSTSSSSAAAPIRKSSRGGVPSALTTSAVGDDDEKSDLSEWEALQRAAEAEEAASSRKTSSASAVTKDADSLDELLAEVASEDPDAELDAEVHISAASAESDTTEKSSAFWNDFGDKSTAAALTNEPGSAAAAAAAASSSSSSAVVVVGDESGATTLDVARALAESSRGLPDKLSQFSTAGMVRRGHVDIDSEDEADELLADTVISGSSRFDIGFADTKGTRSTMEDEMVVYGTFRDSPDEDYVAVFDGHGGSEASAVAAEELHELLATHLDAPQYAADPGAALKAAFESCQRTIEQAEPEIQSGTTAVVAYFQGARGWVANAGDSRAVACRRAKGVAQGAVASALDLALQRITIDHKPSLPSEEARIKAAGGFVTRSQTKRGELSRVCAILGVARALGDKFLQPMVTCVPDVFELQFEQYDALILACDGLWDVVSDAEAAAVVLNAADAGDAARRLRDFAFARSSDDNISVLCVFFLKA